MISSYADDRLYVDLIGDMGEHSVTYTYPDWRVVLNEIDRFFRDGIKPMDHMFSESRIRRMRLTEGRIRGIVHNTVRNALCEGFYEDDTNYEGYNGYEDDIDNYGWFDDKYERKKILKKWYDKKDSHGNTGGPGKIRSYDVGTFYFETAVLAAERNGFGDNVAKYLRAWARQSLSKCPWEWKEESECECDGRPIFEDDKIVNGHLVCCKDPWDLLMFNVYPPTFPPKGGNMLSY